MRFGSSHPHENNLSGTTRDQPTQSGEFMSSKSDSRPESSTAFGGSGLARRSFLQWGGFGALALGAAPLIAACSSSKKTTTGGGASASTSGGSSAAAASLGTVNVQLSWIKNIEFAGEYFADQKGYYTGAGFSSVTLTAGGSAGTSAEAAVATKKAFVGLSAPNVTAPAILAGAKLKTVAATYQKNPFCILSVEKNPIPDVASMKGKKIGVQAGGNTTIFKGLLKANNIALSDVTIVPVQYDPTVVTTGDVDGYMAYITNEPILLEAKGFKTTTFLFADYGLSFVAESYVVSQDTIDNDRAKLKAFLKAEIQGWTDAVANPTQSATYAVSNYGKDQNLAQAEQVKEATAQNGLIVSADSIANGLFTMTDDLIAANIKALGLTGVTITADQLFDLSILKEVYTENPSLITAFATAAASVAPTASASAS
jgi:ABC-type nitrate/sulfonate/bicarbonate transport system substrate-binding protein